MQVDSSRSSSVRRARARAGGWSSATAAASTAGPSSLSPRGSQVSSSEEQAYANRGVDGRLEVSRREHAESPRGPAAPRRVRKTGDIDLFGGCGASEGFGELASCTRELHTSIGSSGRLHSPRDAPVASTRRTSAGVVTSRVRLASSVPARHSASSPKAGSADPDTSSLSTGSEPGRVRTARDEASSASPRAPRTDTWTGRRGVSRRVQQCERCRARRAHANGPHGEAEPLRYAAGLQ